MRLRFDLHNLFLCLYVAACGLAALMLFVPSVFAANIDASPNNWAWNDVIGWIDFTNATVTNLKLQGVVQSANIGSIALDCATSPNGNICPTSNFAVTNDGYGNLSGYAWSDQIGWISFWCGNVSSGDCATANYRVTIDGNGNFSGWAWNEVVGYISFNCANTASCGSVSYEVGTTWIPGQPLKTGTLTSSVFDAGAPVALNAITWRGTLNGLASTAVRFRIASSNSPSGPWTFLGPNGSPTGYYISSGPGSPVAIDTSDHDNVRYFRYYVYMESDPLGALTPEITDIIVNWSP